jgi:hypothetical protein
MLTYQPVSQQDVMMRFARREPGAPRCLRCGQKFHLFFRGGRLVEQRCGCGLVYRVETMGIDAFIEEGTRRHVEDAEASGTIF